jgi:hypothetical protein
MRYIINGRAWDQHTISEIQRVQICLKSSHAEESLISPLQKKITKDIQSEIDSSTLILQPQLNKEELLFTNGLVNSAKYWKPISRKLTTIEAKNWP